MGIRIATCLPFIKSDFDETFFGKPVHMFYITKEMFEQGKSWFESFCNENGYDGSVSNDAGYIRLRIEKERCAVVKSILPGTFCTLEAMENCLYAMKTKIESNIKNQSCLFEKEDY